MQQLPSFFSEIPPAVWGVLSALCFGIADFLARFTSRQFGHHYSLLATLCIGASIFLLVFFALGSTPAWSIKSVLLVVLHGVFFSTSMLLLYRVLARGPIYIVAPIVAAHPLFIVLFAFALGSRLSMSQWLLILVIVICIVVITSLNPGSTKSKGVESHFLRKTIWLSLLTSVAYAVNVVSAQHAVLVFGEINTLWLGHLVAIAFLLTSMRGKASITTALKTISLSWWGVLTTQGALNVLGVLFLFAGSFSAFPEITALLSSEFSVVTILLAVIFLRERMNVIQTCAVAGVFIATTYLATT